MIICEAGMASEFALDAILLQALQNPKDRAFILGSEKTCESLFHPSLQYKSSFLINKNSKSAVSTNEFIFSNADASDCTILWAYTSGRFQDGSRYAYCFKRLEIVSFQKITS
jgi:hypothetical protein